MNLYVQVRKASYFDDVGFVSRLLAFQPAETSFALCWLFSFISVSFYGGTLAHATCATGVSLHDTKWKYDKNIFFLWELSLFLFRLLEFAAKKCCSYDTLPRMNLNYELTRVQVCISSQDGMLHVSAGPQIIEALQHRFLVH